MLEKGCKGYIQKDTDLNSSRLAFFQRYYYSELVDGKLIHAVNNLDGAEPGMHSFGLNDREVEFIRLACAEMTYKEIADKMFLSPEPLMTIAISLFEKLNIKTRVDLVMFAIKYGIVNI